MNSISDYLQNIQPPQYDNIPCELKNGAAWVCWVPEERGDKIAKTPYNAHALIRSGKYFKASATKARSWSAFPYAMQAAQKYKDIGGIGRVLTDRIMQIDLDHSYNRQTGEVHPAAREIAELIKSYHELSPGDGLHIFPRAVLPKGAKNVYYYKGIKVELYDNGRYSTITGIPVPSLPHIPELHDQQAEVNTLVERLETWERENTGVCVCVCPGDPQSPTSNVPQRPGQGEQLQARSSIKRDGTVSRIERQVPAAAAIREEDLTQAEQLVLEKARAAKNGQTFWALWNGGDPHHRNDASRADFDLILLLLYWTGDSASNDCSRQVERLFMASHRTRPELYKISAKKQYTKLQLSIHNARRKRYGKPLAMPEHKPEPVPSDLEPDPLEPVSLEPVPVSPAPPKRRAPAHQDRRITHVHHWTRASETAEQRQQKLQAIARTVAEQVEHHILERDRALYVANVAPGIGKTHAVAELGTRTTSNDGLDIAWIAERLSMLASVDAFDYYRHIEACTRHNCPTGYHLHQAVGERGYNTWGIHKRHNLECFYARQFRESGSAIYQLAHVRTRYPAGHQGIVIDELDITKWLPEREITIARLAVAARKYATDSTADLLLRATAATITDAMQARKPIHGLELFTALNRRAGQQLANWIGELAQDGHNLNTHPWHELEEDDETAQELEASTLAPVVLPHILVALINELPRWQRGQQWNSCLRIGPGSQGWTLYITERLAFTAGDEGLPARAILDATADAEILSLLFRERVHLERAEIEPPPGTRHIAVRTGKRYGKTSLTTRRKDGRPNRDLQRAIAEARYLLGEEDPDGEIRDARKVGLISFLGCIDELGEALGIPEERRLHYWAARGSNALADCDILLVIGTPTVAPATVARLARALWRDDPEPISEATELDTHGIRRYVDPRVQRLNDHLTRSELTQCAHRSRALRQARTVITCCLGEIDYLPATETITDLPQLTPEGKERWTASREAERQKLEQARQLLEQEGKTVHMLTVRELKAAASVSTDAAAEYLRLQRGRAALLQNNDVVHTPTHTPVFSSVPEDANVNPLDNTGTEIASGEQFAAPPDPERAILDYGKAIGYAPLTVGEVRITAGASSWYRFVWMGGPTPAQRQAIYDYIVQQGGPPALVG